MKTCYYELLEVQSCANDNELKKAYRRKALQYHPDKNPDNVEEATEIFATIRAAYEVLSDPQERAWYDSHKQQILNDEPIGANDDGSFEYEVDASVTGVTTDELLMFFNSSLYTRLDDSPAGFYQIAGKVFAKIAKDEVVNGRRLGLEKFNLYDDDHFDQDINLSGYPEACKKQTKAYKSAPDRSLFPPFGQSTTDYEHLKGFYKKWSEFSTLKSFSWKDEYMYSKNYDRRTKREINKRNEKTRQQAKNEYNKTVKRFVAFIKKLDKRMKDGAKKAEEVKRSKARQKQKELRDAYLAERNKQMESNFELQNWQAIDEANFEEIEKIYVKSQDENPDNDAPFDDSNDEEQIIVFDCVLCNKRFKSEKQLENHSKTKLHKKKIAEVQREMKKESLTLGLDDLSDIDDFSSAAESQDESATGEENGDRANIPEENEFSLDAINEELMKIEEQLACMSSDMDDIKETDEEKHSNDSSSVESAYYMRNTFDKEHFDEEDDQELARLLASLKENEDDDDDTWDNNKSASGKPGKTSKGKKVTPDSKRPTQVPNLQEKCVVCGEGFDSRNKLFGHMKDTNHIAVKNQLRSKKRKKKKPKA